MMLRRNRYILAAGRLPSAHAPPALVQTATTFTATTANVSAGASEKLTINVFRWASEQERTLVLTAVNENDDKPLLDVL